MHKRKLCTVLAALRYWQREGLMSAGHERDIADCDGTIQPLDVGEIDELCEELNTSGFPLSWEPADAVNPAHTLTYFALTTIDEQAVAGEVYRQGDQWFWAYTATAVARPEFLLTVSPEEEFEKLSTREVDDE